MQFEEQNAAVRQMKELLRDQAKFRAKLDKVVRKIETSSERTAKLAERNKNRKPANGESNGNGNGQGKSKKRPESDIAETDQPKGQDRAIPKGAGNKVHGDKLDSPEKGHSADGPGEHGAEGAGHGHEDSAELAEVGHAGEAISDPAAW